MPLAVNTGLSDAILARYGNFARGVPSGAEMLLLSAAPAPPAPPQTIIRLAETVWNIQSLLEQNTILNLHLNLAFCQRLAAASAAPAVETMVRALHMRERFTWARSSGIPGDGGKSAVPFVPAALETRGPEPHGEPLPGKTGERSAARTASPLPSPAARTPGSGRGEAAGMPVPPAGPLTQNARRQKEAELPGLAQIRTLLRLAEPAAGRLYAGVRKTNPVPRPNSFDRDAPRLEAYPVDLRRTFPPIPQPRGRAPGTLPSQPVPMPEGKPREAMGFPTPPGSARGRGPDVPFTMATASVQSDGMLSQIVSMPEQGPGSPAAMAATPFPPQGILPRMLSASGITPGVPAMIGSGPEAGMEAASMRLERTVPARLNPAQPAGIPFEPRQKPPHTAPIPPIPRAEPREGWRARTNSGVLPESAARPGSQTEGSRISTTMWMPSQTEPAVAAPLGPGPQTQRFSAVARAQTRPISGYPAANASQARFPSRTAYPAAFSETSVPRETRRSPNPPQPFDPSPYANSPQEPLGRSTAAFIPAAAPLFTRHSAAPAAPVPAGSPQRRGMAAPRAEMPSAPRPAFSAAPVVLRSEAPVSRASAAEESLDIPTVRTRRTETKSTERAAASRAVNAPPADISGPAGQRLSQAVEEAVGHMDLKKLTERVYRELETRLRLENTRRGKW